VRDSYLHLPSSLSNLAKELECFVGKGDYCLNLPAMPVIESRDADIQPKYQPIEYLPYGLPKKEFYQMPNMTKKRREEIDFFYKYWGAAYQDVMWNSAEERLTYCINDSIVLGSSCAKVMVAEVKVKNRIVYA